MTVYSRIAVSATAAWSLLWLAKLFSLCAYGYYQAVQEQQDHLVMADKCRRDPELRILKPEMCRDHLVSSRMSPMLNGL